MIFYDTNGKINILDRSKFISDELYYKKILEIKSEFAKLYPKLIINTSNNNSSINIKYNTALGYTSDNDSDTE
jgi:hypothetical protein